MRAGISKIQKNSEKVLGSKQMVVKYVGISLKLLKIEDKMLELLKCSLHFNVNFNLKRIFQPQIEKVSKKNPSQMER